VYCPRVPQVSHVLRRMHSFNEDALHAVSCNRYNMSKPRILISNDDGERNVTVSNAFDAR
jgi:hypothetical protein